MTQKFKVGDRVMYGKSNYIGIYYIHSLHKYTIDEFRVNLSDEKGLAFTSIPLDFIKLVERKIGDTWVKAEDLDKMEKIKFDKNKCGHTNYDGKELDMDKKEEFKCGDTVECIMDNPEYNLFRGTVFEVENHPDWGLIILRKNPNERIVGIDSKHFRLTKKHVEEKEEFKVDKLGWYESKNGEKFKVVHIKNNENRPVITFSENDECYNFSKEGFYYNRDMSSDCDLVKYLGPELPKEPRKFVFEAEIIEKQSQSENRIGLMSLIVGHYCTPFAEIGSFSKEEMNEYILISKWKVKMEEVLE